jgi:hypothetical protein
MLSYFEVTTYSLSKRIVNISGIVKVDTVRYSMKGTKYFILVCRMIPLEARTNLYTLIMNHNDFALLGLDTQLTFVEQVRGLLALVRLYPSRTYKCIEMYGYLPL